jgi:hypothetical protein
MIARFHACRLGRARPNKKAARFRTAFLVPTGRTGQKASI